MTKYLASYAATMISMLAIDLLWIGVIAKPLYQAGIGHLMAAQPNLAYRLRLCTPGYLCAAAKAAMGRASDQAPSGCLGSADAGRGWHETDRGCARERIGAR